MFNFDILFLIFNFRVEAACFIKTPSVRVSGGDLEIYIDYESLSQPGTRWMRATEELTDVNKYAIIDQKIENTKYQSKLQILVTTSCVTYCQVVYRLIHYFCFV